MHGAQLLFMDPLPPRDGQSVDLLFPSCIWAILQRKSSARGIPPSIESMGSSVLLPAATPPQAQQCAQGAACAAMD